VKTRIAILKKPPLSWVNVGHEINWRLCVLSTVPDIAVAVGAVAATATGDVDVAIVEVTNKKEHYARAGY
jgi:hypothetical protein